MSAIEPFLLALRDADAEALHLRAGTAPGWRVDDGIVRNGDPLPPRAEFEDFLLDLMAEAGEIKSFRELPAFEFTHECGGARFRIHVYRTPEGRNAVIRKIQPETRSAEELGLPEALCEAAHADSGLVLLSGPAGSGRHTTIHALLDAINGQERRHIVSIEKPVVFGLKSRISMVHQIRVGDNAPSFAAAIGTAVSAGANVIAVGNVDDEETGKLVVRAAEAGALVLAVLTAHSVADALGRMLDLFPEHGHAYYRSCLAENLRLACFQQLLAARGGGHVPAFEYARATNEVRALVRDNLLADLPALLDDRARARQYQSLDRCLEKLLKAGRIQSKLALRAARDRHTLDNVLLREDP